jgi:hypothetical protein
MTVPDGITAVLAALSDDERVGWGRLASLQWFDQGLFTFVVPPAELSFDRAITSPFIEQALEPGNEVPPRFRIRDAARAAFLDAQSIDIAWLLAQTAGLGAAYFRGAAASEAEDNEAAVEEIRYLAIADPVGALIRLAAFARERFLSGEIGSVIAAASAAMHWRRVHSGLARRNAEARDKLARVADLVHAMAYFYSAPRRDADPMTRARLLQVALARIPAIRAPGEQWLADAGQAIVAAHLGSDQQARSLGSAADDWAFALAAFANRRRLTKQDHDVTFLSNEVISLRSSGTLYLRDNADSTVRPVVIGMLPRSAEATIDSLVARDRREATIPTLTRTETQRLLAVAAAVECAFPEPGHLAANPTTSGDVYQRLDRLRRDIESWLRRDRGRRRSQPPAELIDGQVFAEWVPDTAKDRLRVLLTELEQYVPVIGMFEADSAAVQVVQYQVNIPLSRSPRWSRLSGRTSLSAAVGYVGSAEQLLNIAVPRGLLPLRFASTDFEYQGTAPTGGEVVQTFLQGRLSKAPQAGEWGGSVAGLVVTYGIGAVARLQVIAAAIVAIIVSVAVFERPSVNLGLGGLTAIGAITAVGGLIELATRFQHRSGVQAASRAALMRPVRLATLMTAVAWALIVCALFAGLVSAGATQMLSGVSIVLGICSALGEAGLFLRDAIDAQRWRRTDTFPIRMGRPITEISPWLPGATGTLDALAEATAPYWAAIAASVRVPVPLPVTWSEIRAAAEPLPGGCGGDSTYIGLAERLTRPSGRRVVVLGGPGSGKTALATLAAHHLSTQLTDAVRPPVPVPVSVLDWHPEEERLDAYAARRILQDFPALRPATVRNRHEVARNLAASVHRGEVVLLLDGIDELPGPARSDIISGIEAAGPNLSVIMTCRTDEYWNATSPAATSLSSAAVIEVEPLEAGDAARALASHRSLESSALLVSELEQNARSEFSTPEMLRLAQVGLAAKPELPHRTSADGTHRETALWLTATAIDLAYRWRPSARRHRSVTADATGAGRWLAFVADTLRRLPAAAEFRWWELYRMRRLPTRLRDATVAGVAGLALSSMNLVRAGAGPGSWLLLLLALAMTVAIGVAPHGDDRDHANAPALIAPDFTVWKALVRAAITASAVAGVLVATGLSRDTYLTLVGASFVGYLAGGLVVSAVLNWLARRHDHDPRTPRGLLHGAFRCTVFGVATPLLSALSGLVIAALVCDIALSWAAITTVVGIALVPMLLGTWGWYHVSRISFAVRGRLPWRLLTFLDDAVDRRLLRRADNGYTFRHRMYRQALAPRWEAGRGQLKMNYAAAEVGRFFRARPNADFNDYQVWKETGVPPSKLYPALQELVAAGWLEERWKEAASAQEPREMTYRLTESGNSWLGPAIAEFDLQHPRLRRARPIEAVTVGGLP